MTIKVPTRPVCLVCGLPIPAGCGFFIASSAGPVPLPELSFCHSGGSCPSKAGCVEGGGAIWGSIPELLAVLWEGSSVVTCSGGPLFVKARGTGGGVVGEILAAAAVAMVGAVAGTAILRMIGGWA